MDENVQRASKLDTTAISDGDASAIAESLGAAAVLGNGFSFWLVNRAKSLRDRQAWVNPTQAARSDFIFKNMVSRDFSVVLLVFALVGKLGWFLWLAAIGVNVFWMIMAWVTRQSAIVRA